MRAPRLTVPRLIRGIPAALGTGIARISIVACIATVARFLRCRRRITVPTAVMMLGIGVIRSAGHNLRFPLVRITLRLHGRNIRQHTGVMIHMLQVIFYIHPVAVDLRIARHIAVFAKLLRGVVLLPLQVLAIILTATVAAAIVVITALTATAAPAIITVIVIPIIVLTHHVHNLLLFIHCKHHHTGDSREVVGDFFDGKTRRLTERSHVVRLAHAYFKQHKRTRIEMACERAARRF